MHNLPQPVKFYYFASIFRYERPQAGRYREHHQFGVEALGDADPALDAEVIEMAWQLYANLGLRGLTLNLNSIGCNSCRPQYLDTLKAYYIQHQERLCPDCRRRLSKNPLRLLDCKNPTCLALSEQAPRSTDHLCPECASHFDRLSRYLSFMNLPFSLSHRLVRGLDYYTKTVFEVTPEGETGSQVAIGGGGRYDNLIEQIGGKPTPAFGFGTGIERLMLNLKKQEVAVPALPPPVAFIAYLGQDAKEEAIKLTSHLRKSGISALASLSERSLKAQLKQANVSGARYAVIIGADEVKSKTVVLKNMAQGEQQTIPIDKLAEALG
jgi:histidyl-tRNA synthetase